MSRLCLVCVLLVSFGALPTVGAETRGIRWEADLVTGLDRAAAEGRPVLFAINAIEQEAANNALATNAYRSPAWGEATRAYVCFVCNDNVHGGGDPCARYEGIPCQTHRDALRYVMRRFGSDLISPQHIVLDGDGRLVYRKQYFTGEVGPELLDALWPRIAPELSYERAGDLRGDRIDALDAMPLAQIEPAVRAWLGSRDALAMPGVLRALDFAGDDARRLALLKGFDAATTDQLSGLALLADEMGTRPDARPEETRRFAKTLLAVDRTTGVQLLARIAAHTTDPSLRRWALGAFQPATAEERASLAEVQLLTGSTTHVPKGIEGGGTWDWRLRRAAVKRGLLARTAPPLVKALADGDPGTLFHALLEATPEEVRDQLPGVAALEREGSFRLRAAAGVALLGARQAAEGRLPSLLWEAVNDPLEGPRIRASATQILGDDPGWNEDVWAQAVQAHLGGSR